MISTTSATFDHVTAPGTPAFDRDAAADAIVAVLDAGDGRAVANWLLELQPADSADILVRLPPSYLDHALTLLPLELRAIVLGYLPTARQAEVAANLPRHAVAELLHEMSADERADLFNALNEAEQERLLPALAQAEREDLRKLASYPEGTAGAVMTSEYATLPGELTAREALEELRRVAPDKETINNAFIVDSERRVVGVVSLRDLVVAVPSARVADLMKTKVIVARAEDSRKSAAEKIARYDLTALPIINGGDRLVGIVTADDAMDIAEAESTESFHRVGTVSNLSVSLRDAGVWLLFRKRIFWLMLLVFGSVLSGAGIAFYEQVIAEHVALVFFLPVLIGSAGNAGAQSATLMVRALGTGDVVLRDWGRMLGRELFVAILLGVMMALAVALLGVLRGGIAIAFVVALTMVLVVIAGSLIGMSLPFLLSRFDLDPATASAPLVTSIADVAGVLIYFGLAAALLPLLDASALFGG